MLSSSRSMHRQTNITADNAELETKQLLQEASTSTCEDSPYHVPPCCFCESLRCGASGTFCYGISWKMEGVSCQGASPRCQCCCCCSSCFLPACHCQCYVSQEQNTPTHHQSHSPAGGTYGENVRPVKSSLASTDPGGELRGSVLRLGESFRRNAVVNTYGDQQRVMWL